MGPADIDADGGAGRGIPDGPALNLTTLLVVLLVAVVVVAAVVWLFTGSGYFAQGGAAPTPTGPPPTPLPGR